MAYSLLQVVNKTLIRVNLIQQYNNELTSLTDTARQTDIDVIIQSWNEIIDDIQEAMEVKFQGENASGTLTLSTSTTSYTLPTDFETLMSKELVETTDEHRLCEYPGGHINYVRNNEPDGTGQANYFVFDTTDKTKWLIDRTPTASENGQAYAYLYQKSIHLSLAADTFPFDDEAIDALVEAAAEKWNKERKERGKKPEEWPTIAYRMSMVRGIKKIRPTPMDSHY